MVKYIFNTLLAICALTIAFLAGGTFFLTHHSWVDFSALAYYNPGKASVLIDCKGNELLRFQLDRREPISFQQLPPHLIDAFLAIEDHHFFSHHGISVMGIVRSMSVNMYHQRIIQGASTITQQLVKLLFFTNERTLSRKIKEQVYALLVERQFTKEQILETYLNHVYLGKGIYGVQAASQRFWAKQAQDLTLAECATLASIVRSPSKYCPLLKPNNARNRRDLVLSKMYALGITSEDEYEEARNNPLALQPEHKKIIAPHACETIRQQIEQKVGKKRLYTQGLTIKTTLDISAQKHAEDVFTQCIESARSSIENVDGALVSIDGKTGAVRALIGGYDYATSQFNRAMQARRQMGSIFKPFVFPERIKQGSTFADTEIDEPLNISNDWNPQNVHKRFEGEMTLARALVRSNNIIAIKNILQAGIDNVIDFAEQCHLPGPFPPYPSLALGCTECSTLQAAAAFNVFANKGVYVEPYLIEWIKDTWGDKVWRHKKRPEQVLAWNVSSQILHGLSLVMHHIKKRMPRKWIASECMGKSGTTNKARTCWFVGATPHLTTAIYLGCDDNQPMKGKVYSVATVAPLWLDYNRGLNQNAERFFYHPALQKKYIHEWTGQTIEKSDPKALPILYDPTIQSLDRSIASYNTAGVTLH